MISVTLYHKMMPLRLEPFQNVAGKGGNPGYQPFLLFPQYFPCHKKQISPFEPESPLNLVFKPFESAWTSLKFGQFSKS